ncbi:hypothetical protein N9192_01110 [Akkermansiaceae bacterium]|nr:hypothetical protein [Akkermansiaceae bacterium]MDB4419006.1 hypothetical protein [bacterium]MDB4508160.1 hypothetical protein [Akkermansiaceae bacterium]MDB4541473.1 hypothetical protein [Akkermansiaceae bacterium]
MNHEKKYWFAAKRYGWGWSLPSTWQGWVTLAVYLLAVIALPFFLSPATHLGLYLVSITVMSTILISICWLKGEPAKWRWGKEEGF